MSPLPNVPKGPVFSFIAMPYPLPQQAQERLKEASATKCIANVNLVDGSLRSLIGEEITRRSFAMGAA